LTSGGVDKYIGDVVVDKNMEYLRGKNWPKNKET